MNTLDDKYRTLINDILVNGIYKENRTDIPTISQFGSSFRINLNEGFPILTTRFHSFKVTFFETMMFLNGSSDTKTWLEDNGINIWKGNSSREFLDNRGLFDVPVGHIGKAYGYQWRNFGGVDQIAKVFDSLKNDPNGRRHIVTAWNPAELDEMSLPPCHLLYQFSVDNGKLSCMFYMRSVDVYLGLPYNIMSYAFITMLFAKALGYGLGDLVFMGGDTHIYTNSIQNCNLLMSKEKFDLPQLLIKKDLKSLEDILSLKYDEVELVGYQNAGKLPKVDMAI